MCIYENLAMTDIAYIHLEASVSGLVGYSIEFLFAIAPTFRWGVHNNEAPLGSYHVWTYQIVAGQGVPTAHVVMTL